MSCDVGRKCNWDPTLLWLRYKLAAIALIQPLTCEFPYAMDVAIKRKEKKKKNCSLYNCCRIKFPWGHLQEDRIETQVCSFLAFVCFEV